MSILGMGPLEVLVILLLAFIFLGPSRMVHAARVLGKASQELRRMASEFSSTQLLMEKELSDRGRSEDENIELESNGPQEPKLGEGPISFQTSCGQKDESDQPKGQSS